MDQIGVFFHFFRTFRHRVDVVKPDLHDFKAVFFHKCRVCQPGIRKRIAIINADRVVLPVFKQFTKAFAKALIGLARQTEDNFGIRGNAGFAVSFHQRRKMLHRQVLSPDVCKGGIIQRLIGKCGSFVHVFFVEQLADLKHAVVAVFLVTGAECFRVAGFPF